MAKTLTLLLALATLCSCHKRQTLEERVAEDIAGFNRDEAPKRIDRIMVLDSMGFDPGSGTISYFHTLEGMADDASVLTDEVRQQHRDRLLESLKGDIQLRVYKERRLNFEYLYYSKTSGELLMSYRFSAEDYT